MTPAEQQQAVEALRRACAETGAEIADKVFVRMLEDAKRGASEAQLNAAQEVAYATIVEDVGKAVSDRFVMNDASKQHFGIVAANAFMKRLDALSAGMMSEGGRA